MRCALYARAATRTECDTQLLELRAYVERRGWPPGVEYLDVGTATRPQLAKLMKAARRHEFEMVLVDRADRWGRDIAHWVVSIQELIKLHVAWTVPSQGLYTDASEYLPMASMIDAMAGFLRQQKRERIQAGMRKAERRTYISTGRPKKVFDREKLFALRDAGKSIRVIAAELKIGRGTVQRLLLPARTGE